MSKTLLVIGGLGVAACVTLSFAMQRLVEIGSSRQQSPFAAPVHARFGARLRREIDVIHHQEADGAHLEVVVDVVDWHDARRLGPPIAAEVLLLAQRSGVFPREVLVRLRAPGEREVLHRQRVDVPRTQPSVPSAARGAAQPPAPRAR